MNLARIFPKSISLLAYQTTLPKSVAFHFGQGNLQMKRRKQADLAKKLRETLKPSFLQVIDTSIGSNTCGQMYRILIESPVFQGKSRVQQHQMVAQALEDQMKSIHGFSLKTKVTEKEKEVIDHENENKKGKDSDSSS